MLTGKRPFIVACFVPVLRWTIRHRFHGIFIRGAEHLRAAGEGSRPLIVCSNHTNWWDGFMAGLLTPLFPGRDFYFAQYEALLQRYPMCGWLGAFGIDIDRLPIAGLRYALRLLKRPGSAIWIFPQGVIVPQWIPIRVKPGALWLAGRSGAAVLPVVFRYEWLVESRPSLFVHCGPPLEPGAGSDELQEAMQQLYDAMTPTLEPLDLSSYTPLYPPRPSLNRFWDWIRGQM